MGGDLGALLGADARAALGAEVARHPHPPRAAHQDEPGRDDERGDQAAGRAVQVGRPDQDRPGAEQHQCDAHPGPHRAGADRSRSPPASGPARRRRPAATGCSRPGPPRPAAPRPAAPARGRGRCSSSSPPDRERAEREQHRDVALVAARLVRPRRGPAGRTPRTAPYSTIPAPPAAASSTKASRTSSTSTPRWSASPRATPASTRPSLLRYSRGALVRAAGVPRGRRSSLGRLSSAGPAPGIRRAPEPRSGSAQGATRDVT